MSMQIVILNEPQRKKKICVRFERTQSACS